MILFATEERNGRKETKKDAWKFFFVVFALFCGPPSEGAWPTYHGGADLKGVADVALGDTLELAWRYDAYGEVYSTPVSDGERIFVSAKKGRVVALDLTGKKVWERSFARTNDAGQAMALRFEAPLACTDGLVFAGSTRGTLFALDAGTGETRWTYETDGIIVGSPNFIQPLEPQEARRVVVMDQSEGMLHCLEAATGRVVWKSMAAERCDGTPGVANGRIAYGSCLAALHVYATDGTHLRDIEIGGDAQIAGGVAIEGRLAYAGLRDGALACFDIEAGEVLWSSEESDEQTFSTPAVTEVLVVYASDDGFVYAVDKKEGKPVWKFNAGGLPYSPVVAKDRVVVTVDGVLYLLKLSDGTKLWSKEVSDDATSAAIIGGMVVVGADDGTVTSWRVSFP
ncbi:PQQ-binding-like beta-propeller repeat protein [Pontiella sp.]|uniref:outer membrane protein assembly factor BamB family protein n=1 Tax=Pontiella sp. TaxID=2837462 RepID=UPI003563EF9B